MAILRVSGYVQNVFEEESGPDYTLIIAGNQNGRISGGTTDRVSLWDCEIDPDQVEGSFISRLPVTTGVFNEKVQYNANVEDLKGYLKEDENLNELIQKITQQQQKAQDALLEEL